MAMLSLIVMEPGSEWPGHVGESENVVEVGDREESLLQRVQQRLDSLRLAGARVRIAVLACNEAADPASMSRRADLARALLVAVAAAGFGRLVLSAKERSSAHFRVELLSLVGALSQSRGRGPTISVKFNGARERTRSARSDPRLA